MTDLKPTLFGADDAGVVFQACGIRVGYCTAGDCHVELLDARGAVFARASMDQEVFSKLLGEGADVLQALSHGGLAMMPAGGHA